MNCRTFAQVVAHQPNIVLFMQVMSLVQKRLTIGMGATAILGITFAEAQEACVVCSGPAAVYRCTIEKSEKLSRFGALADKAIQAVCTRELARSGGHQSCAARRDAEHAICDGIQRELPLASLLEGNKPVAPPSAAQPATAVAPGVAPMPVPPTAVKEGPPKTMKELAERTGATSKQQFENAGEAAAKSWDCVISLFTKC